MCRLAPSPCQKGLLSYSQFRNHECIEHSLNTVSPLILERLGGFNDLCWPLTKLDVGYADTRLNFRLSQQGEDTSGNPLWILWNFCTMMSKMESTKHQAAAMVTGGKLNKLSASLHLPSAAHVCYWGVRVNMRCHPLSQLPGCHLARAQRLCHSQPHTNPRISHCSNNIHNHHNWHNPNISQTKAFLTINNLILKAKKTEVLTSTMICSLLNEENVENYSMEALNRHLCNR